MKVYELEFEVNDYQFLSFEEERRGELLKIPGVDKIVPFDATPLSHVWGKNHGMWVYKPQLKKPDLWSTTNVGVFVAPPQAYAKLARFFEMAAEMLPVMVEGEEQPWQVINVLDCINCLDHDKCQWAMVEGRRIYPKTFVFNPHLFDESTLFKIPEVPTTPILVREREGDPECEFKAACEHLKIKGVHFKLLWEG